MQDEAIGQAKIELAAALRWAARLGYQSGVCNHFSVAVPGRPELMLINPEGYFWAEARVSDLVIAQHDGAILSENGHTVEQTAFCIHAPIHRLLPQATAVLQFALPISVSPGVRYIFWSPCWLVVLVSRSSLGVPARALTPRAERTGGASATFV